MKPTLGDTTAPIGRLLLGRRTFCHVLGAVGVGVLCVAACEPPGGIELEGRGFVEDAVPWRTITFEVEEVARFGWTELADSSRPLTGVERRGGGGVLSRPIGLGEDDEGNIHVLEGDYQKVVVFGPEGTLERVLLRRYGQGPGEFARVRHMALDREGVAHILDDGNSRLTALDANGEIAYEMPLDGPTALTVATMDGSLLISRSVSPPDVETAVEVYRDEEVVRRLVPVYPLFRELSRFGASGILASAPDGVVLFAHPGPGIWTEIGTDTVTRGRLRYPDARGYVAEVPGAPVTPRVTSVATYGIGRRRDGTTLLWYTERAEDGSRRYFIDRYAVRSAYVGSAELSEEHHVFGRMLVSRMSDRVYFTSHGDVPAVVALHLTRRGRP